MSITSTPSTAQLLDFAALHPGPITGNADDAVRKQLGITPVRYLQLLNRAIWTAAALQHDPQTTHRLRRIAEQRSAIRAARTNRKATS